MNGKNRNFGRTVLVAATFIGFGFTEPNLSKSFFRKDEAAVAFLPVKESVQIRKNILDFLNWYKMNINKANSIKIVGYDTKGYGFVIKKSCTEYLELVKSSGFVSTKYISYWQKYFDDKAVQIKKDKLTKDEVPEGFDFDLVLLTQEPELVLDNISKLKCSLTSINKTKAVMAVSLPGDDSVMYDFEMQKTAKGWVIDYIATQNYD